MTLTEIRRGSLVDEVIDRLREQIVSGAWPVGTRIPPETELIATLRVGRGTLREAVRALSHAGLLDVRRGDGTYVRARSELSGALRRQLADMTFQDIQEARRALEVEAARLAARRRTDEDLEACGQALAERDELLDRVTVLHRTASTDEEAAEALRRAIGIWVDADARFHELVVAAARNPLLLELYLNMGESLRSLLAASVTEPELYQDVDRNHERLLAALRDRDPGRATRAVLANLENFNGRAADRADV